MRIETINLYPEREDVTLTAYLHSDSAELLRGSPRPAVVICPGGGYISCSEREGEPVALRFASLGYHAFVLRYSVYTGVTGKPWRGGGMAVPDSRYCVPAQMLELGKALLAIRQRAAEWKVDPEQIAICGFSAGGHNCAMYATHWSKEVVAGALGADPALLRPNAMILGYALLDLLHGASPRNSLAAALDRDLRTIVCGESPASEERLSQVSPYLLVDEDTPPTFLWATGSDQTVPVQHSLRFALALAEHHIPFEMHVFEQGPHGLALADQASASDVSEVNPDAAKWVPLAQAWLAKRFALPLSEGHPNPLFGA